MRCKPHQVRPLDVLLPLLRWQYWAAVLEHASYRIRPYDYSADARRWVWLPPQRCGLGALEPDVQDALIAIAAAKMGVVTDEPLPKHPLRIRGEAAVHGYRADRDRKHLDQLEQDGYRKVADALTMEGVLSPGEARQRYTDEIDAWLRGEQPLR